MIGFGGTLDTGQAENLQKMKGKLFDGLELKIGLESHQLR